MTPGVDTPRQRAADASRRALVLAMLAVVLAVTCTMLGRWQWHRNTVRHALITEVTTAWDAPVVRLDELVTSPDAPIGAGVQWRRVEARGHWLPESTVLVRNRPVDSVPAFHVLTPLVTTTSSGETWVVIVDRGWVPTASTGGAPQTVAGPGDGDVDVVIRLRPSEAASTRDAPPGQVQAINVTQAVEAGGVDLGSIGVGSSVVTGVFGVLDSQQPEPSQPLRPLPPPQTDPGPHLSYAFQWWVFAAGSLLGFGTMARRELTDAVALRRQPVGTDPASDEQLAAAAARDHDSRRRPARRSGTDEDLEDAVMDARDSGDGTGR